MKKMFSNEMFSYLFFGVLTTAVYFVLRFLVINLTNQSLLAVVIAQIGAILFAFITNKFLVFKDLEKSIPIIIKQFITFLIGRSLVFFLDITITYLAVEKFSTYFIQLFRIDQLPFDSYIFSSSLTTNFIGSPELLNEFIFALIIQILAIVLNYLISKKKVFKKPD